MRIQYGSRFGISMTLHWVILGWGGLLDIGGPNPNPNSNTNWGGLGIGG